MVKQQSKAELYQEVKDRRKRCRELYKTLPKKRESNRIFHEIQEAITFAYSDKE